jgi:hypothetical protein
MTRYRKTAFAGLFCLGLIASPQMQARAQTAAPVAGQPYQIPAGYTGYGAGTLISYGGFNYVIQDNGTMLLAADSATDSSSADQPVADQPYQIPAEFTACGAGTQISYGGFSYVVQDNGTMLLAVDTTTDSSSADQPVADQPYQIPADFAGADAGSVISYGGYNYVSQGDGTMLYQQSTDISSSSATILPNLGAPGSQAPVWNNPAYTGSSLTGGVSSSGVSSFNSSNVTVGGLNSVSPFTGQGTVPGNTTTPRWRSGRPGSPGLTVRPSGSPTNFVRQPATSSHPSTGHVAHPGNHMVPRTNPVAHPVGPVHRPNVQTTRPFVQHTYRPMVQPHYNTRSTYRPMTQPHYNTGSTYRQNTYRPAVQPRFNTRSSSRPMVRSYSRRTR